VRRVKDSVVEYFRSGHEKQNKAGSGRENRKMKPMMFTGTLIDDLIATVERAEQKAQAEQTAEIEAWFASVQENTNYDSNFLGVA
jgi:hypothetical protein